MKDIGDAIWDGFEWLTTTRKGLVTLGCFWTAAISGLAANEHITQQYLAQYEAKQKADEAQQQAIANSIQTRLKTSPHFKAVFESNVRKCIELEVSPLAYSDSRDGVRKAYALQQARKEVEPACRRDELQRWQNTPSSYLVSNYR